MPRFLVGRVVGVVVVLLAEFLFLAGGGMPAGAHGAKPLPLAEPAVRALR